MKAIRVHQPGEPDVLRLEEVPPPAPGSGQVLIRVHAIGVNPVETYIRSGKYPLPPLPYVPGTDAAGVIEAIGPDVKGLAPGDRVYTSGSLTGTYAERSLCSADQVHHLPAASSFEDGAALNIPYATAWRALFQRARAIPGEWVLIHGATGGVGVAATQIARAAGLQIIGTGGTERGRKLVQEQGAHVVLDHTQPGYMEKVLEATGGQGANIILEMLANVNLGHDLNVLARGGRVVVVGNRGTVEINPRELMRREAAVLGVMLFAATGHESAVIHSALRFGLENKSLKPVIGQRIPLAEAPRAHRAVMEPGAWGKILLVP